MSLFLLFFFTIYSLLHLYVFLKARAALAFGIRTGVVVILFMTAMVFAPVIVRMSERYGSEALARSASYAGYMWMGMIFLFFSLSLAIDIWHLFLHAAGAASGRDLSAIYIPKRQSFVIPLLLSVVMAAYGYFEARDIRTEKVVIMTDKIPKEIGRLRIAQISDVHLGLTVRKERLENIINEIKRAGPDIIVSTGDLVDGQINNLAGLAEILKKVSPRYGKFAITGNHEFYAGIDQALAFIKDAGFTILRGEAITVEGIISIAGVDDPAGKIYGRSKNIPEKDLLSGSRRKLFTVLLKHRPVIEKDSIGLFDLQLSGHTHKGQIFPFSIATWLYYPVHAGKLNIRDTAYLYVSRGSGTWGPPIRFLSPPEVTVIDIIHKDMPKTE
jgi:predicted MPP superfamily phosphohydrolase